MMNETLLLSGFKDNIRVLINEFQQRYSSLSKVDFVSSLNVGDGSTMSIHKNNSLVKIGVPENWNELRFFWQRPVVIDRANVVKILTAFFHEMEHVHQINTVYQNEQLGFPYVVTELAGWGNVDYYLKASNYTSNLNEIDAEKSAIQSTFSYLLKPGLCHCSNQEAESMLLDYVNYRVRHSDYFVHPKDGEYTSFDDVIRDFEEAERQAPYQKREYMLLQSKEDLIFQMTCHCDHGRWGIRPEWEPYLDEFWSPKPGDMPVGLYQDMLIASMVNYAKPEAKNLYGALQRVDLSPEHVFGKSFPDLDIQTSDEMMERYKQNLRLERLRHLESDFPFLEDEHVFDGFGSQLEIL